MDDLRYLKLESFKVNVNGLLALGLYIRGIEVTQAIQYFDADQHLTDPADRSADNSVRLVADKPAWVRVHLGSLFGVSGVSGSLELLRRRQGFLFDHVATLGSDPSSATAVPAASATSYAATRGSIGASLNFIIPANEMIGTLRLAATVSAGSLSDDAQVDVDVTLRQTLRLAGVMISYSGPANTSPGAPNLQLAAPTLADLQNMAGTALTLFPVQSTAQFRTAGSLTQTVPLIDPGPFPTSGCGASWDTLLTAVANVRTADGNQQGWVYYGLLPNGTPIGMVGGCGGGGVAVGPINAPGTLAHEAGHACGLAHAPAGGPPNPDPNYPAYKPYPTGSIGEYGLNINNGNIASPQSFKDLMSYAAPSWVSPYNYGKLQNTPRLNPVTVGIDYPWWKDLIWETFKQWPPFPPDPPWRELELPMFPPSVPEDVISLIVRVERGTVTSVEHVARTRVHTQLPGATPTNLSALLTDGHGAVLARGSLMRLPTSSCGCGNEGPGEQPPTYIAQVFIPNVEPGAFLEIADGDEVVWRREAPADPARVGSLRVKVNRRGSAEASWDSTDGVLEYWLRWSRDGETWQSVATGLTDREMNLEPGRLPPGEGHLQVVAHDGFFSAYSEPVPIQIPDRAAVVSILHPVDGHTYTSGQTLRLWGATTPSIEDSNVTAVWTDGRKEIATGLDDWATLEPGEHTLTLRVGGRGGGEASVTVNVSEAPY